MVSEDFGNGCDACSCASQGASRDVELPGASVDESCVAEPAVCSPPAVVADLPRLVQSRAS